MSNLLLDTNELRAYANRIDAVNRRLHNLDSRIDSLYHRTGLVDLLYLIQTDAIIGYSLKLSKCADYLRSTATEFERVESILENIDVDLKSVVLGSAVGISSGTGYGGGGGGSRGVDSAVAETEEYVDEKGVKHIRKKEIKYGEYKDESLEKVIEQKKHTAYTKNKDEDWYDKTGTILEGSDEKRVEVSVWSAEGSADGKVGEGEYNVDALTAEAYAGYKVGLYVYEKDKNGKVIRKLSPGVSAEVGASAAVFEADAEGRIGFGEDHNMLGLYGKGELDAVKAEAKAKLSLNKDEIHGKLSAEADLVKVKGSAGVSVLGTDIGASGSLKVGVGVHAEAGFTDGKLKVDIGAAVGVGFDLGFEVDVSGTIDAATGVAKSIWHKIGL